jgi:hypothetical protein
LTTLVSAFLNYRKWLSLLLKIVQQNFAALIFSHFGLRIMAVLKYNNKFYFFVADVSTWA